MVTGNNFPTGIEKIRINGELPEERMNLYTNSSIDKYGLRFIDIDLEEDFDEIYYSGLPEHQVASIVTTPHINRRTKVEMQPNVVTNHQEQHSPTDLAQFTITNSSYPNGTTVKCPTYTIPSNRPNDKNNRYECKEAQMYDQYYFMIIRHNNNENKFLTIFELTSELVWRQKVIEILLPTEKALFDYDLISIPYQWAAGYGSAAAVIDIAYKTILDDGTCYFDIYQYKALNNDSKFSFLAATESIPSNTILYPILKTCDTYGNSVCTYLYEHTTQLYIQIYYNGTTNEYSITKDTLPLPETDSTIETQYKYRYHDKLGYIYKNTIYCITASLNSIGWQKVATVNQTIRYVEGYPAYTIPPTLETRDPEKSTHEFFVFDEPLYGYYHTSCQLRHPRDPYVFPEKWKLQKYCRLLDQTEIYIYQGSVRIWNYGADGSYELDFKVIVIRNDSSVPRTGYFPKGVNDAIHQILPYTY